MRNYYLEQSHGTYTVQGDIKDWVTLDLPESYYGADSDPWNSTDDLTGPVWRVARDAIVKFAANNPDFDWAQYDQENPYGITGADFNQPDGYLDHLILVHAGSDQSAGGGAQESDAIWAHSWGIYENHSGGPGDGPGMMIPGTDGQGPEGQGIWAYNYTIDPEDGDVGRVLPRVRPRPRPAGRVRLLQHHRRRQQRLLDDHGQRLVARPRVGPRHQAGGDERVGQERPRLHPAQGRQARPHRHRQAAGGGRGQAPTPPASRSSCPRPRTRRRLSGKDGALEWYSTMGNDVDVALQTKEPVSVGANTDLTFRTWYDIEEDYDYGFVEVSADGGATWQTVKEYTGSDTGPLGRHRDRRPVRLRGQGRPHPLRVHDRRRRGPQGLGSHRHRRREHRPARVGVRDRRLDPRRRPWQQKTDRYYIAEYRTYDGFDESLKNCYQFNAGYASWVDWFSYNRGLHLIYRDTFYQDNDVASHIGVGGWMVVDAHP